MDRDSFAFLIADVARMMRYRFDTMARGLGVTRPQWRVLTTLARMPGESQAAIADFLEIERITLCRMIDRLQEAGLLERRADPADRRVWRIFLTPAGEEMNDRLQEVGAVLHDELRAVMEPEEEPRLQETLKKLRDALSKRTDCVSATA
jgi:DNA-binding MarR family transcriptional regulator